MATTTDNKPPEFLNYNTIGLRPVKTTFNMDCESIIAAIKTIASKEIDGIQDVTYEHDRKTGTVLWFIWFDSNSDHFIDRSTANTAIGRNIPRYSQQFQDFARKFGWCEADDDPEHGSSKVNLKSIVRNNQNQEIRRRLTCLQISINPFLVIMFDANGGAYQREFGQNTPKVYIERKYQWRKGSGEEFHTLVGMRVEKVLANAYKDYRKPRATKNGSFN